MFKVIVPKALLLLLVHSAHGAGNLVDGPDVDLRYDPASGNVILDTRDLDHLATPFITSFVLGNQDGSFRTENAVFPFVDAGTNTVNTPSMIGQSSALSFEPFELFELGEILPSGFANAEELSAFFRSQNTRWYSTMVSLT